MKLICPHCGIGGTADRSLYGKKLKCPECGKVFVLDDWAAFQRHPRSSSNAGENEAFYQAQNGGEEGYAECSCCGYRLKRRFMRIIDGEFCCTVCVPD